MWSALPRSWALRYSGKSERHSLSLLAARLALNPARTYRPIGRTADPASFPPGRNHCLWKSRISSSSWISSGLAFFSPWRYGTTPDLKGGPCHHPRTRGGGEWAPSGGDTVWLEFRRQQGRPACSTSALGKAGRLRRPPTRGRDARTTAAVCVPPRPQTRFRAAVS